MDPAFGTNPGAGNSGEHNPAQETPINRARTAIAAIMRYAANPNIWGGSKYGIKNVCAELANSTDTGTALARHTAQIDDLHRRFKEMLERLPSPGELISSKDALKLVRDTTLNDAFIMALILVNSRDKEIAQQVESKLQAIVRPLKSDILDDLEDKVRTLRADGNTIPVDLADNVDRVLADFINSIDDPAASTLYPNRIRAVLDYLPEVLKRHSRSSSSIILINQQWKEHRISDRQAVLAAISVLDGRLPPEPASSGKTTAPFEGGALPARPAGGVGSGAANSLGDRQERPATPPEVESPQLHRNGTASEALSAPATEVAKSAGILSRLIGVLKRFPFLRFGTSNSSKGDGATNGADSSDKFKGRPSLMEGLDFAGIEDADEPTTRSRGQRDAAGNISRDPKSAQLPESMQRAQRRAEERAANMKAAEATGIKPDRPLPGTRNTQEKLKAIASRRPGRKNQ